MKVHKLEIYIIDFDELGAEEVLEVLESAKYPNRCISPYAKTMVTRDMGDWSDESPLNNIFTRDNALDELFKEE